MPEIKHQLPNSSAEISLGEIHIPDDGDLGTGTFTTTFTPSALPATKEIMSAIIKAPVFQITATIRPSPNPYVPVMLGADKPLHVVVFVLPAALKQGVPHVLAIHFAKWRIMGATLDDMPLRTKSGDTAH